MSIEPSEIAIQELGLMSYTEIHAKMKAHEKRIGQLELRLANMQHAFEAIRDSPQATTDIRNVAEQFARRFVD
jgi:hypothetical protein